MANRTSPLGGRFTGWFKDDITPALKYYLNGTLVMTASGNDLTLADALTVTGISTLTGAPTLGAYTLPVADGSSTNNLQDNGSGVVTWEAK